MASGDRHYLTVRGPGGNNYGYGRMQTSFEEHLTELVDLVDDAEVVVNMMPPDIVKGWWAGQRRVLFTMWETSFIPPKYHEPLPQFDQVVVPCEHNRELFERYHDNVAVVPLGIDTKFWKPGPRPKNTTFRFLAGGSHWKRKGLDAVVEAWDRLRPAGAELVLKCPPVIIGGVPEFDVPNVTVINHWLSMDEERDLYRSADCFIAASRGEGWGLMPLQAISAGVPTLMTDTSGHKEFAHLATRLIATNPADAVYDRYYQGGLWDEPDVDSLVDGMTWMLDNRSEAKVFAEVSAKERHKYSWAKAAQKLVETVEPTTGRLPRKTWQFADEAVVDIKVNRKVVADIGRHHVRLDKGEIARVPINVRDTLRDAGYLEVS